MKWINITCIMRRGQFGMQKLWFDICNFVRRKRKILLILLIIVFAIGLWHSAYNARRKLNGIIDTQVPFATLSQWLTFTQIDTDTYGRQLYYCETVHDSKPGVFSAFGFEYNVNFYLIIQKRDNHYTFFLEDKCYLYAPEQLPEEGYAQFLEDNQWNQSIDQTLMTSVLSEVDESNDCHPFLSDKEKNTIHREFRLKESAYYVDRLLLEDGNRMYILRENPGDKSTDGRTYVFLIENDQIACKTELIGHPNEWPKQIAQFKEMATERNNANSQ